MGRRYQYGAYEELFNIDTKPGQKYQSSESYKIFQRILEVSQDRDSGFVTIAIKHQSPHVAQEWTNLIVNQIKIF